MNEADLVLQLNGRAQTVPGLPSGATVAQVVQALELVPDRIAVELNGEIVRRSDWATTSVTPGSRMEVVHFVGGGAGDHAQPR